MSEDRGWLPSEYQDEITPALRPSPNEWIVSLDDGAPALAACWEDGDQDNLYAHPWRLTDGQIVQFDHLIDHGSATLTVNADGSFTVNRPMPTEANFVRSDFENADDSVENLVKRGGSGWHSEEGLAVGEHDLDYYQWSEDIPFRFDAATRSFQRITGTGGENG